MAEGYVEFEFDLPAALLARLIEVFAALDPAVLGSEQLAAIPDAQGVYQLFLDGDLAYIGKTDADGGRCPTGDQGASALPIPIRNKAPKVAQTAP